MDNSTVLVEMATTEDVAGFLAKAIQYLNDARPLLPMYTHLILSALFPIYVGTHASLSRPASAAKPAKPSRKKDDGEDEEEEDKVQKMEGLSSTDAIILPVTAGLTLGGLYFLIMRYGADLINLIMGYYFAVVGIFSVAQFVNDMMNVLVGFLFPTYFSHRRGLVKISVSERKAIRQNNSDTSAEDREITVPAPWLSSYLPRLVLNRFWDVRQLLKQKYTVKAFVRAILELDLNLTLINVFSALAGLGTTAYVTKFGRTWFITNLQGFAVTYSALQLLSPTTFATGTLILSALFCYDIWAVFFTPLMIAVATKLDQPIKLVFPKPDEPSATPGEPPVKSYSMLGLGDIVVPGLMIGLALRFDLYMFYLKKQREMRTERRSSSNPASSTVQKAPYVSVTGRWGDRFWTYFLPTSSLPAQLRASFPKPYFAASMIGYVVGMLTTLSVMTVFQHAQPALLYLVPGVILSLWGTALVRGEIKEMWDFSEAVNAAQVEQDDPVAAVEADKEKKSESESPKGLFERIWTGIWGGGKAEEANAAGAETASVSPGAKDDDAKQADKKTSKQAQKAKASKDADKDATSSESEQHKGLIFSFSIAIFEPKSTAQAKPDKSESKRTTSKAIEESPAADAASSEGSDDVIVVSSPHLDETPGAVSPSRYRTRRTRNAGGMRA